MRARDSNFGDDLGSMSVGHWILRMDVGISRTGKHRDLEEGQGEVLLDSRILATEAASSLLVARTP